MSRSHLVLLVAVALVSAGAGFLAYTQWSGDGDAQTSETGRMPSFALPDLDANMRDSSEWDGQVRVVNFWATWCPPCRREIPLLVELQTRYGDDIQILGIAIDDLDAVQEYASEQAFNYPVLVGQQDAVDLGNDVLADWIGLPFTAFVDSAGRIVRVHVGELHEDQATEFLAEIL